MSLSPVPRDSQRTSREELRKKKHGESRSLSPLSCDSQRYGREELRKKKRDTSRSLSPLPRDSQRYGREELRKKKRDTSRSLSPLPRDSHQNKQDDEIQNASTSSLSSNNIKKGRTCGNSDCTSCSADPCGKCYNCRNPQYKKKCVQRYSYISNRNIPFESLRNLLIDRFFYLYGYLSY